MSLLRILTPAFCIVLAPWLVADQLPRFEPQPLLIEVKGAPTIEGMAPASQKPQRYWVTGQSALETPVHIKPQANPILSTKSESELFDFIAYALARGQKMEKPEELLEYSFIADQAAFAKLLADPQTRESILQANRNIESIDYQIGWFQSPRVFYTIGKAHYKSGRTLRATGRYILTDEGWKAFFSQETSPLQGLIHLSTANGANAPIELKEILNVQPTDGTQIALGSIEDTRNEILID